MNRLIERHRRRSSPNCSEDQVWRESGLGALDDIDQLTRRIAQLEQQITALGADLADRDEQLEAAREANRDLIRQFNPKWLLLCERYLEYAGQSAG